MKRYSKKRIKKLIDKKCFFCAESNYNLLDTHRILEGAKGGKYLEHNMLTICSNCHRRVHAGEIVIDRKYDSTSGPVVHYFVDGVEYWRREYQKDY